MKKLLKFPKPKKRSIKGIKVRAASVFQRWSVLKSCELYQPHGMMAPCISCGIVKHYSALQGGHFKAGRGNAILFEENNCWAQCRQCNGHLRGRLKPDEVDSNYRRQMIGLLGWKEVKRLEELKHTTKEYTYNELKEIYDLYKSRLEQAGLGVKT